MSNEAAHVELQVDERGVIVPVRAAAGARRNAILGTRQGMLRVAVTAAPEKGKANRAIVALLSEVFGVTKSAVQLVSGETSPQKRFLIVGADPNEIRSAIARALEHANRH
jgi:uncharacterized protein (TIGR00251 family)